MMLCSAVCFCLGLCSTFWFASSETEFGFSAGDLDKTGKCQSKRLFLGSLSDSNAKYIPSTGIYQQQAGVEYNNRPVYRHITSESYIYFLSGRQFGAGFWAVGSLVGSQEPTMSILARSSTPDVSQEEWRLWDTGKQAWTTVRYLKLICVDKDFVPCTTGRILLKGISSRHSMQHKRMGVFVITNRTYNLRPVYKHELQDDYMFHTNEAGGKWIVGPTVGRISGGMFVSDFALRPEFIFQTWVVFAGRYFVYDQGVRVQCYGVSLHGTSLPTEDDVDNQDEDDSNSVENDDASIANDTLRILSILHEAEALLEGSRGRGRNNKTKNGGDECEGKCQNGGRCKKNDDDDVYFCICDSGYFGANCQMAIDCGQVPESVDDLEVVSSTGHFSLDVIFYRCPANKILEGSPGIVCQIDGSWSNPPICAQDHILLTPEDEETVAIPNANTIRSML